MHYNAYTKFSIKKIFMQKIQLFLHFIKNSSCLFYAPVL